MIRQYLALLTLRAAARGLRWLVKVTAMAALVVAAAPVSIVAACSAALAWARGWPPRRLYSAALWCLPMLAVWLAATGLAAPGSRGVADGPGWYRIADAPYHAWLSMWLLATSGHVAAAAVAIAPPAIPLGLAAGGLIWSYRIYRMETGTGGLSPGSAISFDRRQWRRQVRSARARIAAPGSVPLTYRNGDVVIGATIRAVRHPAKPVVALPYARLRSHQVVIGTTGTGKTTLLLRLWAGFMATALSRQAAGTGRRPLLVVLDCKGGADSRRVADRARRVLRDAGARATAIWPDDASLSLWDLPPDQLTTTLLDLIEHGTGSAAYYADVMEAIVALAVDAPPAPPAGAADFLSRLDADWLAAAYSDGGRQDALAALRSGSHLIPDVALRFRTLWRRLGTGFEPTGGFGDADAWYCILEGTAETSVAEAQARALVDMLASYISGPGRGTEALLAVDEFSAVSRRLPIWMLYERARSLGLAVQVSAQSWQGLAADEDERYRIAATAEGGIWLLRTPHPDPVVGLAGMRRYVDSTRRMAAAPTWSDEGTSRVRHTPVVDPELVRGLGVGQAAYVHQGGVTYVQVKRLVGAPAALPHIPAGAPGPPTDSPAPAAAAAAPKATAPAGPLPDVSGFLDEAFGREPETRGRESR
ncbi:MAG TPA: hypothetical protein VE733_21240 [Streptosporangiaceae bacterium]|nr:hypothetical protein [Streptosporangiaceae bacterium]